MNISDLNSSAKHLDENNRDAILKLIDLKTEDDMEKILSKIQGEFGKFQGEFSKIQGEIAGVRNELKHVEHGFSSELKQVEHSFSSELKQVEHSFSSELKHVESKFTVVYWVVGLSTTLLALLMAFFSLVKS